MRILCVHLKAKLEVAEAKEIRRLVRDVLRTDPETRLILMGDFNDTKNEQAIWWVSGKPEWPDSFRPLSLTDDRGELWTEFWSSADLYYRIDYIMVSKKLESDIDMAHSDIARPDFWNQASNHCPVTLSLKIPHPAPPIPAP